MQAEKATLGGADRAFGAVGKGEAPKGKDERLQVPLGGFHPRLVHLLGVLVDKPVPGSGRGQRRGDDVLPFGLQQEVTKHIYIYNIYILTSFPFGVV